MKALADWTHVVLMYGTILRPITETYSDTLYPENKQMPGRATEWLTFLVIRCGISVHGGRARRSDGGWCCAGLAYD